MYFDEFNRPQRNFKTGRWLKGCTPHNKGKKMADYCSPEKIKKILAGLEKGRLKPGDPFPGGPRNKRKVAFFNSNGTAIVFESSEAAARAIGVASCGGNIRRCCNNGERGHKRVHGIKFYWWDSEEFVKAYKEINNINQ